MYDQINEARLTHTKKANKIQPNKGANKIQPN